MFKNGLVKYLISEENVCILHTNIAIFNFVAKINGIGIQVIYKFSFEYRSQSPLSSEN